MHLFVSSKVRFLQEIVAAVDVDATLSPKMLLQESKMSANGDKKDSGLLAVSIFCLDKLSLVCGSTGV